ncbi:MAG: hypothetical protein ABSC55_18135 [Syntrophorhabdales bacterium]
MDNKKKDKRTPTSKNTKPPNRRERRKKLQENSKTILPRHRAIGKQIGVLVSVFLGIITVSGFLFLVYPRVSVYPGEILDPHDPFQTPFIISNDGYLPLQDIRYSLVMEEVKFGPSTDPNDNLEGTVASSIFNIGSWTIHKLGVNKTSSITFKDVFKNILHVVPPNSYLKSAVLDINLACNPYVIPYVFKENFRFRVARKTNGEYVWFENYDAK